MQNLYKGFAVAIINSSSIMASIHRTLEYPNLVDSSCRLLHLVMFGSDA